jgi:hypothetical protein
MGTCGKTLDLLKGKKQQILLVVTEISKAFENN